MNEIKVCSQNLPTQPYKDMSDKEIQREYQPSGWTSRRHLTPDEMIQCHIKSLNTGSETARSNAVFKADVPYGMTEKQKMDIFLPETLSRDCPILIYIHGGYWQLLGRECSAFPALPVLEAGGGFVCIGYDLSPQVRLDEIICQVKEAVHQVLKIATQRGSRGVYLCGHSAGGHLVGMMLTYNWSEYSDVSANILKGGVPVSGAFDVRPLVRTSENINLQLTEEQAWESSVFRHLGDHLKYNKNVQVLVAVGADESPEFIRLSKEYYEILKDNVIDVKYLELPNEDHFTIIERLQEKDYSLTKEIIKLMGLWSTS